MALFYPPFASDGERRNPDSNEQSEGFPCGPADRTLFNGTLYSIQAEMNSIQIEGGVAGDENDNTTVVTAIQNMIDAATGGGGGGAYVLMTQARARMPIFPIVDNVAGHFGMVSPGTGQVRIPAGVNFLHRGIFTLTSAQTDFATDPNKTYHVRWNPTDGFAIKDLAGILYNPSALAETNILFDSTYDDMLVARVITNSSNVPTIVNLVNRDRLLARAEQAATMSVPNTNGATGTTTFTHGWARTPIVTPYIKAVQVSKNPGGGEFTGPDTHDHDMSITISAATRYLTTLACARDYAEVMTIALTVQA